MSVCRLSTPTLVGRNMRMHRWAAVPCMLAALGGSYPAAAQHRAGFEGRFAYEAEGSDDIRSAIDRAVAPMNFFIRPIARVRLRNANPLARSIVIERTDGTVLVHFDDDPPVRAPATGEVVPWTRADGERMRIRMAWNDGELHQSFIAEDGRRDNVFVLQTDGSMLLTVTITSERLPRPLVYRLRYRRE